MNITIFRARKGFVYYLDLRFKFLTDQVVVRKTNIHPSTKPSIMVNFTTSLVARRLGDSEIQVQTLSGAN